MANKKYNKLEKGNIWYLQKYNVWLRHTVTETTYAVQQYTMKKVPT